MRQFKRLCEKCVGEREKKKCPPNGLADLSTPKRGWDDETDKCLPTRLVGHVLQKSLSVIFFDPWPPYRRAFGLTFQASSQPAIITHLWPPAWTESTIMWCTLFHISSPLSNIHSRSS